MRAAVAGTRSEPPPSTRVALADATAAIAAAGCETPRLDAELLLAHALGVGRERLLSDRSLTVTTAALADLRESVRRRALEREPVAYIVGRRAFRTIELDVDPRALVPRPETELLVQSALALAPGTRVLDLGTGSGAVALALASERPDLVVSASDVSADALALARSNGVRLGLEVRWLQADLLAGIPEDFDAILANLPYVGEGESDTLAPEIVRHEPTTALYGGPDGLALIRRLSRQLAARPRVRFLALEVGAGQAARVRRLLARAGFQPVRAERDLAGIERVLVGEGRAA